MDLSFLNGYRQTLRSFPEVSLSIGMKTVNMSSLQVLAFFRKQPENIAKLYFQIDTYNLR